MPSQRAMACVFAIAIAALFPATASATEVTMLSSPPGLKLSLNDEVATTPFTRSFAPGTEITIDAPEPQTLFGYDYAFGVWGGRRIPKRSTDIVPETDIAYEAIFRFAGRRTVVGSDVVGDHVSGKSPGRGEAYRVLASRSGTIDRLRLFLDESSEATALSLGLYADAGGTPGALLAAGTAETVRAGAWNEVQLALPPKLVAGRSYWIGLLNPSSSEGVLRWRDRAGGSGGGEETTRGDELSALPATWVTGAAYSDGPLSAYGLGPAPAAPDLAVDVEPGRLAFAAKAGGDAPAPQSLVVQANNGGCGPCHWEISDDATWLSETPGSGDWPTEVTVSVDTTGLNAGTYHATVALDRGEGVDRTTIPVVLRVAAPADHLVGAWSFDEASGATASDSSGHGNDGHIDGAQHTTVGLYGSALAFDSASDTVEVPDSDSLHVTDGVTIEGWVRPNVLSGPMRTLAAKQGDDELAWGLFAAGPGGLPSGHATTDVERYARGTAKVALTPTWTHLATTYDGSRIRLYVNGRLVAITAQKGALITGSGPLSIGNFCGDWFDGLVDEVRVYDRALTAGEILVDLATPLTPSD
jgi:hypothetical protein